MNTNSLIAELSDKVAPVKYLSPLRMCAEWLLVVFGSIGVITFAHGIRADWTERVREPVFVLEILFNIALLLRAGCAATLSSYPDRAKMPALNSLLLTLFLGYSLLLFYQILSSQGSSAEAHGVECLLCILSFAAIPAFWMAWRLRKLASTVPALVGGAVTMMAMAAGCLGVRLIETETSGTGLFMWHYLPLVLFSLAGLAVGKKLFRW